jgi:hypothetical protein
MQGGGAVTFLHLWLVGIYNPAKFAEELKSKPAPLWGFAAVAIRFSGSTLTTGLLALITQLTPFQPSSLTFLPTEVYYRYQLFFLPLFGLAVWLLMSGVAHTAIRLAGRRSDFDQVLNIIGLGMLVPMPVVWLWDGAMIGLGTFQLATMALSHSVFQLWEASVQAVCLRRNLGLGAVSAVVLAVGINIVFILMATIFVR